MSRRQLQKLVADRGELGDELAAPASTAALRRAKPSSVLSVQPTTTGSTAASVVEERQVDDQVDHSSDRVDRQPLLPSPTVSGLLSVMTYLQFVC